MAIVVGYVATKEGRAALKRAAECVLRGTKLVVISSHRGGRDFDADEAARFESELDRIKGVLEERASSTRCASSSAAMTTEEPDLRCRAGEG